MLCNEKFRLHALPFGNAEVMAVLFLMQRGDKSGRAVIEAIVCAAAVKDLTVFVECNAPAVQACGAFIEKPIQLECARVEAPDSAAIQFTDTVGRLNV